MRNRIRNILQEALGREVLYVDEHYKDIVWEQGEYSIAVNNPNNATYITLWKNGKRVGFMQLDDGRSHDTKGYATVHNVEINRQERGIGLGTQMYRIALKYVADKYKGIGGEGEQRANNRQVPAIYKRLGGRKTEDGSYVIDRKREE